MKLDKYTIPTGNWTPGRRMAVHYVTAALRKLHAVTKDSVNQWLLLKSWYYSDSYYLSYFQWNCACNSVSLEVHVDL